MKSGRSGEGSGVQKSAQNNSNSVWGSGNQSFSVDGQSGRGGRGVYESQSEKNDRRSHGISTPSVSGSGSGNPNFSGGVGVGGHRGGGGGGGRGGYNYQRETDRRWANEGGWNSNSSRAGRGDCGSQKGESDRIDALGRWLSSVLRHRAVELNLNIRRDGYVAVPDLLNMNMKTRVGIPLHCHTVDDFKEVVKRDNKQRFALFEENNVLFIRANQGHSINFIESERLLKPIVSAEEVPMCIHGTYLKNLESIKKNGLSRMTRNHIHFARGLSVDKGVISGMRSDCEVWIYLDVRKALEDGMKLFVSENGVILTEGFHGFVPPKYFAKIDTVEQKRNKN